MEAYMFVNHESHLTLPCPCLTLILYNYACVCVSCLHVSVPSVSGADRGQEKVSDSQLLELQVGVSCGDWN